MSTSRNLRLEIVLQAVDRVTRPFRNMLGSNNALARAVRGTRDRIRELDRAQANIDSFRKLTRDAAITGNQLKTVQARARDLARQIAQVDQPTRAMTRAFQAATREAQTLKRRQAELQQNAQAVRTRLTEMGMSTQNLVRHQRELRQQLAGANQQLAAQQQRLAAVAAQQRRVEAARQTAGRVRAAAGHVAGAGVAATAAGYAAGRPLYKGLGEAKHDALEQTRLRALGLGDQVSQDAIKFANGMKTYGTSAVENIALIRDALSVFADEHHAEMVTPTLAKMKFASAAVFGAEDGAENERRFMDMLKVIEMRGGLASEKAFREQADMVQRVITATGGRVGPEEWLNLIKTGGIAAKGIDDKAFYYQLEPLVQEMGGNRVGTAMMSAYANIYQGKTTKRAAQNLDKLGLIADPSKVMHDKAGQISQLGVGALAGSELFRHNQFEWMEKVLLPKLAEKGITDKNQVLDTIGSIFSNRTAANLFSQMYLQREQIHKNAKLNANADGIDGLYERAKGMPQGKELETVAKVHDLQRELGQQILPLYTRGLEMAANAAKRLTKFMQEHPTLAKALAVAAAVLVATLLVLGPLLLGIAAVLGPYAMLHILLTRVSFSFNLLSRAASRFPAIGRAVQASAAGIRVALAGAWQAGTPSTAWAALRRYTTALAERIPAASKAASLAVRQWGIGAATSLQGGISAVRQYTLRLWQAVAAQAAASRAAAATRWTAVRQYAGSRGAAGVAADAARGGINVIKGGAVGLIHSAAAGLARLGQILLFVGRIALANPIGLLITLLVAGAALVIKYWEPIKAFFGGFWQGLTEGLAPLSGIFDQVFSTIGTALAPLQPVFDWVAMAVKEVWDWITKLLGPVDSSKESLDAAAASGKGFGKWLADVIVIAAKVVAEFAMLPVRFIGIGVQIIEGLINGMKSMVGSVKNTVADIGGGLVNAIKDKLGIRSPSRVFAQLGAFTMSGLEQGLSASEGGPLAVVGRVAKALAAAGAGMVIGTGQAADLSLTTPPFVQAPPAERVPIDTRPPLARPARASQATAPAAPASIVIHIHPPAGTDERAIARAVAAELQRLEAQRNARARSRLTDWEE